jgi:hypothetical protein
MKDLVWELFLMVRELMPASETNSRRQQEWAARFHELEVVAERAEPVDTADHDEAVEDVEEPDDDTPHVRAAPKRRKR